MTGYFELIKEYYLQGLWEKWMVEVMLDKAHLTQSEYDEIIAAKEALSE